jgi:DNA modification methylase
MARSRQAQKDLDGTTLPSGDNDIDEKTLGRFHPGNSLNDLTGREWIKFTKSWFILNPASRSDEGILHPAKYPEELVAQFLSFFTKRWQNVLDPFLGTGSTLVACNDNLRRGYGIELIPKWADIAKNRVSGRKLSSPQEEGWTVGEFTQKIAIGDSRQLPEIVKRENWPLMDYCITSPPYGNILRTSRGGVESAQKRRAKRGLAEFYSDDPSDLGNLSNPDDYMSALVDVFSKVSPVMREGAYVTIVLQNIRSEEGDMEPLAWELALKLRSVFTLKQERIWCQDNKLLGIWGYPKEYVSNVHHHYCLVLQKE